MGDIFFLMLLFQLLDGLEDLEGELTYKEHLFGDIYHIMWLYILSCDLHRDFLKWMLLPHLHASKIKFREFESLANSNLQIASLQTHWKLGQGLKLTYVP